MDPIAAKYIAAGLACIGMGGDRHRRWKRLRAIPVGRVAQSFGGATASRAASSSALRSRKLFGIVSLLIVFLLLFVFKSRTPHGRSRLNALEGSGVVQPRIWKFHGCRNRNRDRDANRAEGRLPAFRAGALPLAALVARDHHSARSTSSSPRWSSGASAARSPSVPTALRGISTKPPPPRRVPTRRRRHTRRLSNRLATRLKASRARRVTP